MRALQLLFPAILVSLAAGQPLHEADGIPYEVRHVQGNIYIFASTLGNVTIQVGHDAGHDGVLLVDTGALRLRSALLSEVHKLSTEPVRFIVNTSGDSDHIGSNDAFLIPSRTIQAQAEVALFAQDNVLQRFSRKGSGVPAEAWPTLTYLDGKSFAFNGEAVQIIAEKAAHTDGDSIVLFRGSNVLSAGDIFLTTGYPVIDLERGGSIQGEILALNHILDLTVPRSMQEGGTMVIPGHGRLCDESEVTDYRDMITIIRDRVQDMLHKGKTLEEVKAARLSRDYDRRYSTNSWTGDMFVEAIYKSLSQGAGGKTK
ncbi:MAG: MBL fold metallo-hydrolase [Bryobacterales bacterium]|nr:MBL fold metallo-hydrolase [Bryobacterales bacterium]